MKTLAISVRSAFKFFACGMYESRVAIVREMPRLTAANPGSGRRRGVAIGGETERFRRCLCRREARASSSRARTVFEGVIFFALASAFIALRVSSSPFASRYASTAGTRSAAFALIAQLSVGKRVRRNEV